MLRLRTNGPTLCPLVWLPYIPESVEKTLVYKQKPHASLRGFSTDSGMYGSNTKGHSVGPLVLSLNTVYWQVVLVLVHVIAYQGDYPWHRNGNSIWNIYLNLNYMYIEKKTPNDRWSTVYIDILFKIRIGLRLIAKSTFDSTQTDRPALFSTSSCACVKPARHSHATCFKKR